MARTIKTGGGSEYSSVVKAQKEQWERDMKKMKGVIKKKKAIGKAKKKAASY